MHDAALIRCQRIGLHSMQLCVEQRGKNQFRALKMSLARKTGILLLNMGGPSTLDEVGPFLSRLFADGDLIPLPFQSMIAPWIARRRTPQIKEQYAMIGGGSPIKHWTEQQGHHLTNWLNKNCSSMGTFSSYVGFRYAAPLVSDAVSRMKADGVDTAIALSLYPQYSCSTTGSSLNELYRQIQAQKTDMSWSVIDRWATHSGLINTFASHIRSSLEEYPEEERKDVVLIFSAHSLPMSVVNRGDPYPAEVAATVSAVMDALGHSNPYRLVWQSQVGPSPWLGPKTEHVVKGYAKQGKKNLLVVPIAFVSDHIETLFELDIEYGELASEAGIGYKRVESLNASPLFISTLGELVKTHLDNGLASTTQYSLRCPLCTSEKCGPTKSYFQSSNNAQESSIPLTVASSASN